MINSFAQRLVIRQIDQIVKLSLTRKVERTFCRKVTWFNRHYATTTAWTILQQFCFNHLEAAIGVS